MTASHRRPSVEIFSMLFGIVYLTCFYMDWAPFRYYPDRRTFHIKITPQEGPAILWYGWVTAAAVVSAAIAVLVPRRLAERIERTRRQRRRRRRGGRFSDQPVGRSFGTA